MHRWKRFIQRASRSRGFLWRFSLGMLGLSMLLGYVLHHLRPADPELFGARILAGVASGVDANGMDEPVLDGVSRIIDALEEELTKPGTSFERVLDFMPMLAGIAATAPRERVYEALTPAFPIPEAALGADVFSACARSDAEAIKRLHAAAADRPPVPLASHALGLVAFAKGELHKASEHFRREGERPEAIGSRLKAVECLATAKDFALIHELQQQDGYRDLISSSLLLQAAIHQRDWPAIIRLVPLSQFTELDSATLVLALVTALAWTLVLVHLGEVPGWRSGFALMCLLGLVAGVLSTTPTIFAVIWQDDILGFAPEGDYLRSAIYFLGAVGVREELCKLALFLPFLPILIRRGDEMEALIVASFVGLGFAVEENGNYFFDSGAVSVASRFLTANFFHVVLTGLNGLALFRAFTRGISGLNEFTQVLGITIIAHGMYDVLLSLPDPTLGSFLSLAVYVLTVQFYFGRIHSLRTGYAATLSLSGSFVTALTLLTGTLIAFQMMKLGPVPGLVTITSELIGSIILLVMFFREFNEPLAE